MKWLQLGLLVVTGAALLWGAESMSARMVVSSRGTGDAILIALCVLFATFGYGAIYVSRKFRRPDTSWIVPHDKPARWWQLQASAPGDPSAGQYLAGLGYMVGQVALVVGGTYMVIHFLVKYW